MLILDVDGDGVVGVNSDLLTIVKYVRGNRGLALTTGTILPTSPRHDPQEIEDYIRNIWYYLDVDGDGTVDFNDAQMIYFHGASLNGVNLVGGRISAAATRTTAAMIEAYLDHLNLDLQRAPFSALP